jgi:hypothetical protein
LLYLTHLLFSWNTIYKHATSELINRKKWYRKLCIRSWLSWDITQCRVAILYPRFGTTYQSHLVGLLDPLRWDRYVVPKRQ